MTKIQPPCNECHAHKTIEKKLDELEREYKTIHVEIVSNFTSMGKDIKWVILIGKWLIGVLGAYMVFTNYYIFIKGTI